MEHGCYLDNVPCPLWQYFKNPRSLSAFRGGCFTAGLGSLFLLFGIRDPQMGWAKIVGALVTLFGAMLMGTSVVILLSEVIENLRTRVRLIEYLVACHVESKFSKSL